MALTWFLTAAVSAYALIMMARADHLDHTFKQAIQDPPPPLRCQTAHRRMIDPSCLAITLAG